MVVFLFGRGGFFEKPYSFPVYCQGYSENKTEGKRLKAEGNEFETDILIRISKIYQHLPSRSPALVKGVNEYEVLA
jgi:hypothetical protein